MSYIYGASVQGIQGFIFETNKLKEIAGASSLVDEICTTFFEHFLGPEFDENRLILGAAGNIKYLFEDQSSCERVMREFPRAVMKMAPGITISQAAVELTNDEGECFAGLETRLRTQRNKIVSQHGLGLMIAERSRRTGKPSVEIDRDQNYLDKGQLAKISHADRANNSLINKISNEDNLRKFPLDTEDIVKNANNSWIAVIHADANNLGNKIIGMTTQNNERLRELLKSMSKQIELATIAAARKAFDEVVRPVTAVNARFPFRPIIIGGDDLTVVIRGDLAVDFTHLYLKYFEQETREKLQILGQDTFKTGLSACAGIAFIKSGYPFHYGVALAEELCAHAKKVSKHINSINTPSSLHFHKVHSSFIEDYKYMVTREKIHGDFHFDNGPYFLNPQQSFDTIDTLKQRITSLNEKGSPKSRLRNWLTAIKQNPAAANQDLDRIMSITNRHFVDKLDLERIKQICSQPGGEKKIYLYDAIALSNIIN